MMRLLWLLLALLVSGGRCHDKLVINTWDFQDATVAAFNALSSGASALDAVEEVCGIDLIVILLHIPRQ